MRLVITRERPDTADAQMLIAELEAVLDPHYAPESRHGYSVDKLIRAGVHFFVLRADGVPAACGGIQFYPTFGELKRMFARARFRGRGFGYAMLAHLEAHARAVGSPSSASRPVSTRPRRSASTSARASRGSRRFRRTSRTR